MLKVIIMAGFLALAAELLVRKYWPKAKAEVVVVESKVDAKVAAVKADVAKVETVAASVKTDVSKL